MKRISAIMIATFLGLHGGISQKKSHPIKNESYLHKFMKTMATANNFIKAHDKAFLVSAAFGSLGMAGTGMGLWYWLHGKEQDKPDKKDTTSNEPEYVINGSLVIKNGASTLGNKSKTQQKSEDTEPGSLVQNRKKKNQPTNGVDKDNGQGIGISKAKNDASELNEEDIFAGDCGSMVVDKKQDRNEAQKEFKKKMDGLERKNKHDWGKDKIEHFGPLNTPDVVNKKETEKLRAHLEKNNIPAGGVSVLNEGNETTIVIRRWKGSVMNSLNREHLKNILIAGGIGGSVKVRPYHGKKTKNRPFVFETRVKDL